jgi:hypothetical protein
MGNHGNETMSILRYLAGPPWVARPGYAEQARETRRLNQVEAGQGRLEWTLHSRSRPTFTYISRAVSNARRRLCPKVRAIAAQAILQPILQYELNRFLQAFPALLERLTPPVCSRNLGAIANVEFLALLEYGSKPS